MKKAYKYDTRIDNLFNEYVNTKDATFISDWDVNYDLIDYDINLIKKFSSNVANDNNIFKYFFWTDDFKIKKLFCSYVETFYNEIIQKENFTISSNGTSSLFLSLIALRKKINNVCVISPNYFTTINVLFDLNFNVYNEEIIYHNTYKLSKSFRKEIIMNDIELILVTNPLFGTGYEIFNLFDNETIDLINNKNITILCDNMYGGMNWNKKNDVFDISSFQNIKKFKKYIFLDSPSKRLFLNGAKFCTLISNNTELICNIESLSINYIGSMSALQISSYQEIYNPKNHNAIINNISKNISTAKTNYRLICNFFNKTKLSVLFCESGYFCLLSLPKNNLNDNDISILLLNNYNILTIPHSRYLLNDTEYYYFRVNLLIDISKTIYDLSILLKK